MAKFRFLSFVIIILSCVCTSHAQDSFFNPYSFRYHVEFSSELGSPDKSRGKIL